MGAIQRAPFNGDAQLGRLQNGVLLSMNGVA